MSDAPPPSNPDLSETVLDEVAGHRETVLVGDIVVLVEQYDEAYADERGVPVDRLVAYVENLARNGYDFDPDGVREGLDGKAVDSDTFAGTDAVYWVGEDRVSAFPPRWHDELDGETDVVRYVEVMLADIDDSESAFDHGGAGSGIPVPDLVNAVNAMSDMTREQVSSEINRLHDEGVFEEDTEQHPEARVRLVGQGDREDVSGR
ncbi:hypothetical protein [Halopelagius longus]|uniref:Uncharacterized protein n=1 Tax=Halopelagius longus TaxID=1236180 RepID=A0A1H1DG12_9EURY|nr:hypothetical protein [Halopelagius longus]RDI71295.1 hypothetical protein DWB78_05860 [Halopelagius longus]SDQ74776.1 hypothetical protein SAMN05216278_2370 [Halopelagius longus]